MAPISRSDGTRSYQNGQINGLANSQDPPPSTLAANFANNLSTQRRPSRHDDQDDFQQLLAEVSKYEGNPHEGVSIEEEMEHCHELICVVVIGVLEVLSKSTAAINEQELQKASEGLDVLIMKIKEFPVVLDQVPGQRVQLLSGSDDPLWFWLFPQILALVGSKRCETLQDKIKEFFTVCFTEVSNTLQLWALNSAFFGYLRHCANSKQSRLGITNLADVSSSHFGSFAQVKGYRYWPLACV
jgi:serine/threonine-protein kinase ATR